MRDAPSYIPMRLWCYSAYARRTIHGASRVVLNTRDVTARDARACLPRASRICLIGASRVRISVVVQPKKIELRVE